THQGFGNFGVDVLDGTQHALAQVAGLVAVAQFDGFARTGGRARGHRSPPHGARFEQHVAFHGGVAARIEDFASDDVYDCTHGLTVLPVSGVGERGNPAILTGCPGGQSTPGCRPAAHGGVYSDYSTPRRLHRPPSRSTPDCLTQRSSSARHSSRPRMRSSGTALGPSDRAWSGF